MIKRRRQAKSSGQAVNRATTKAKKMHLNVPAGTVAKNDQTWLRFRVPPSQAQPKAVFTTCHYCGYDPGVIPANGTCPKCGGHSWERNAISIRLLPKTKR